MKNNYIPQAFVSPRNLYPTLATDTHPAGQLHFAKTGKDPVVLQITVIKPKGSADKSEH